MEFHAVANLFPMMQDDEFNSLCADIAKNGQLEPIWTHEGKIIDGRNRYRACLEVGVAPQFREWNGQGSLVSFVLSLNLERRHLTSGQRAALAVEVLPALEAEARERQGKRNDLTFVKELTEVKKSTRATQQAATLLNTNRQYVSDAKKLKSESPDLFEKVKGGEMSINSAKQIHKYKSTHDTLRQKENSAFAGVNTEELSEDDYDARRLAFFESLTPEELATYERLNTVRGGGENTYYDEYSDLLIKQRLKTAPPEVKAVVTHYGVESPETVEILTRLHKSNGNAGSSNTFEEIVHSGYIQPTGEDDAVHITDDPRLVKYALEKKSRLHRETAAQAKGEVFARGEREILEKAKEIRNRATRERHAERTQQIAEIARGNAELNGSIGLFPVIYADPPWRYEHSQSSNRDIENQYPTMSLGDICDLPVCEVSTDDCILFLWATSPKLAEAIQVVESWGFTYRTCMVWDKEVIGMGYYARQRHEMLLICTKGNIPVPLPENRPASVYTEKRGKHSAKPAYFAEMIEQMYPSLPKLEMFARSPRDGWAVWGNQSNE